jgi:hypothetical protein
MDWTRIREPVRWRAGTAFVPTADGWLVHTPAEELLAVEVPEQDREPVARLFGSKLSPAGLVRSRPDAADLLDVLATEDVIVTGDGPDEPVTVLVIGDGPLVAPVERLLGEAGFAVRAAGADDALAGAAAVIGCARWLPDRDWCSLDARCAGAGIPWHRGYAEGRRWYVGPFSIPSRSASYADLRLRRLAAAQFPDELAAYWSWLDDGGRPAGTEAAQPGPVGVAAGLLVTDLVAWRSGLPVPGADVQTGVDPATGTVRRHPVLPVPSGLMREASNR